MNNNSAIKAYFLAVCCLIFVLAIVASFVYDFQDNQGCAQIYSIVPVSCSQYSLQQYVFPAIATALPFLFIFLVLIFKERKGAYQLTKLKQEKTSFWFFILTIIIFLLSIVFIKSIRCESFGCLGLSPLILFDIVVFPPLIFSFSLWFLKSRYHWEKWKFLMMSITLAILLLFAYIQGLIG